MKLTAELILQSAQFTNALKDRELDLRGMHFVVMFCIFSADQYSFIVFCSLWEDLVLPMGYICINIPC